MARHGEVGLARMARGYKLENVVVVFADPFAPELIEGHRIYLGLSCHLFTARSNSCLKCRYPSYSKRIGASDRFPVRPYSEFTLGFCFLGRFFPD
jgi:hypothetical protein